MEEVKGYLRGKGPPAYCSTQHHAIGSSEERRECLEEGSFRNSGMSSPEGFQDFLDMERQ